MPTTSDSKPIWPSVISTICRCAFTRSGRSASAMPARISVPPSASSFSSQATALRFADAVAMSGLRFHRFAYLKEG